MSAWAKAQGSVSRWEGSTLKMRSCRRVPRACIWRQTGRCRSRRMRRAVGRAGVRRRWGLGGRRFAWWRRWGWRGFGLFFGFSLSLMGGVRRAEGERERGRGGEAGRGNEHASSIFCVVAILSLMLVTDVQVDGEGQAPACDRGRVGQSAAYTFGYSHIAGRNFSCRSHILWHSILCQTRRFISQR